MVSYWFKKYIGLIAITICILSLAGYQFYLDISGTGPWGVRHFAIGVFLLTMGGLSLAMYLIIKRW